MTVKVELRLKGPAPSELRQRACYVSSHFTKHKQARTDCFYPISVHISPNFAGMILKMKKTFNASRQREQFNTLH